MDAKLIKKTDGYYILRTEAGKPLAISEGGKEGKKLSLKNCQAIELGYDLDELAVLSTKEETTIVGNQKMAQGFIKGFQKALSILGDKKFSEDDMISAFKFGWERRTNEKSYYQSYEDFFVPLGIPSKELQQTEWDVEIVMRPASLVYISNLVIEELDADGCLILKRK